MSRVTKKSVDAICAAALIVLGIAAPSFAEGTRDSYMNDWTDGDASSDWTDKNKDSVDTRVVFDRCTLEFKATIRHTRTGLPDPSVGSEYMNCASGDDAVHAGDLPSANYHFDVSGLGIAYCVSGLGCVFNTTDVPSLHIRW